MGAAAVAAFITAASWNKQPTVAAFATFGKKAAKPAAAPKAESGDRLLWFPGATVPEHLTGELLGDRGFDPLNLGKNPKDMERNRVAEIFHGRLAMLAFVGAIVPELFNKPAWFNAGSSEGGDPVVVTTFLLASIVFLAPLEIWRINGQFGWEAQAGDKNYPGFDPFGLANDEAKLKEIKNGRLAMTAVLGFIVQFLVTGQSPLDNLAAATANFS